MITKNSKIILIADDDALFRAKISDIVVEAGHKVRLARDGTEAVNELISGKDAVNLMLLDLQMPSLDGFGVLKWMHDNGMRANPPALVVTGIEQPWNVTDSLKKLGAVGLIAKTFTPEELIFRVNKILFSDKAANGTPRKRVPVSLTADFSVGNANHSGTLLNLSESGVFLHTPVELLTGAMLNIKFSLPGSGTAIDVKGLVRWTTGDSLAKTIFGGGGVMFTAISQENQDSLRLFVAAELKRLGLDE